MTDLRPVDEARRLARLRELVVLDSAPEPVFDSLARLASEVCGTPIALVSLVDAERQWFKANVGLPGINETPRDIAFCAHAIAREDDAVFEVPDATQDARFAANPLVTGEPDIRFYAGAPLTLPGGERVGTLCVIDREPRRLDAGQASMLRALAAIASQALAMRHELIMRSLAVRSAAERELRELTAIFDHTVDYVVQADAQGWIAYMNPAGRRLIGIAADAPLGRRNVAEFNTAETNRLFVETVIPVAQAQGYWLGEAGVYAAGGREVPVSHLVIAHRGADGAVERYSAVMRDISADAAAKRELQRQSATLRSVSEAIPAIVAVVDADGRYRFVNSSFERWYGAERGSIVGRSLREVLGDAEYERSRPFIERAFGGESVTFEKDYPGRDAARFLSISYIPLRLDDGSSDGFVGVAQDITLHRIEQERLLRLSQRDPLTGLLNRAGFEAAMERAVEGGDAASLALLYIDLDRFKPVNDAHGHPVGDQLLQAFARRLQELVRPTDAVARLGGDEFAILLAGVREHAHAGAVADKVIAAARAPFAIDDLRLAIGASVGIALGADAAQGWRELLARADARLYAAKQAGRGRRA